MLHIIFYSPLEDRVCNFEKIVFYHSIRYAIFIANFDLRVCNFELILSRLFFYHSIRYLALIYVA